MKISTTLWTDVPLSPNERRSLGRLIEFVESEVPAPYRATVLDHLLPRVLSVLARDRAVAPAVGAPAAGADVTLRERLAGTHRLDFSAYQGLLVRRGESLLKALIALHVGQVQLGIRWMTPTEIAFLLREVAGVRSAYRSNISNALRQEASLVTRRPRGRGYEYGLTRRGVGFVNRQLALVEAEGGG